tara:strand:+ start:4423 stop:4887 length:465 start_codon:yes stop_codon:yes gene_type:complete
MKKIALIICSIILGLVVYYFYPEHQLKEGQIANKIVINKAKHELLLYSNESLIASYKVSLSNKGLAKKKKEGDNLTPEGVFRAKKMSATKFHKAIGVGKWEDCCKVRIHGQEYSWIGKFQRWYDWTQGCIALTNDEIDEIYNAVENGIPIEINP